MNDRELGLKVFKSFWDWNRRFNPNSFNYSFDEFLSFYGKKKDIYLDGIGGAVRENDFSDAQTETAMRTLANSSKGKIPSSWYDYFRAFNNEVGKINWIDAGVFVVSESAGDALGGAQDLGKSLITSAKVLNFILPALIIGGVLFLAFSWINTASGGGAVKLIKGIRK